MVKLVDTRDLKSLAVRRIGSIPVSGTKDYKECKMKTVFKFLSIVVLSWQWVFVVVFHFMGA